MVESAQTRQQICDLVASVRQLCQETRIFTAEKLEDAKLSPDMEERLSSTATAVEDELRKCFDLQGDDEQEHRRPRILFKLKLKRSKTTASSSSSSTSTTQPPARTEPSLSISSGTTDEGSGGLVPCKSGARCGTPRASPLPAERGCPPEAVCSWSAEQVAHWLSDMGMREYQEHFLRHDIRGPELLSLERRDLKELGIAKVGHIKRILQAVADMKKP